MSGDPDPGRFRRLFLNEKHSNTGRLSVMDLDHAQCVNIFLVEFKQEINRDPVWHLDHGILESGGRVVDIRESLSTKTKGYSK